MESSFPLNFPDFVYLARVERINYKRNDERARGKRARTKDNAVGSRLIRPSRRWTTVPELFY